MPLFSHSEPQCDSGINFAPTDVEPVVVNSNKDVIVYANNTLAYADDYNVISEAVVWH